MKQKINKILFVIKFNMFKLSSRAKIMVIYTICVSTIRIASENSWQLLKIK